MKPVREVFGNRLRVRASGLVYEGDSLLLIKHNLDGNILWAPPGGGVEFGESIEDTLVREFKEETQLSVIPGSFLFFTEFIHYPLHAIELFYKIESFEGKLLPGIDPEIPEFNILLDIGFFNQESLNKIPKDQLHKAVRNCNNPIDLLDKRGHLK